MKKIIGIITIIAGCLLIMAVGNTRKNDRDQNARYDFYCELLSSRDKHAQIGALNALGSINDPRALPLIRPLINDFDLWVKVATIRALAALQDTESLPLLVDLLNNSVNPPVRREAALALGQLADTRAFEPLVMRLKNDNNPLVRLNIIRALGLLGDSRALTTVKYYGEDKDIWIRTEANNVYRGLRN